MSNKRLQPHFYPPKDEWCRKEAKALLEWVKVPENVWLHAFPAERGYWPQRLHEMCKANDEFNIAYNMAKEIQRQKILYMGLSRKYDPWLVKFLLQAPANIDSFRQPEHQAREIHINHDGVFNQIEAEVKKVTKEIED